jgi:hypothetical protein
MECHEVSWHATGFQRSLSFNSANLPLALDEKSLKLLLPGVWIAASRDLIGAYGCDDAEAAANLRRRRLAVGRENAVYLSPDFS